MFDDDQCKDVGRELLPNRGNRAKNSKCEPRVKLADSFLQECKVGLNIYCERRQNAK